MKLVLDASVAIASLRPRESGYEAARARLRRLAAGDDVAVVPSLFVMEVAGGLARLGVDAASIDAFLGAFTAPPHEVVTIGRSRARSAARIAIAAKLRGADAAYLWLGAREGLPVCTLDHELTTRGASVCVIMAP